MPDTVLNLIDPRGSGTGAIRRPGTPCLLRIPTVAIVPPKAQRRVPGAAGSGARTIAGTVMLHAPLPAAARG